MLRLRPTPILKHKRANTIPTSLMQKAENSFRKLAGHSSNTIKSNTHHRLNNDSIDSHTNNLNVFKKQLIYPDKRSKSDLFAYDLKKGDQVYQQFDIDTLDEYKPIQINQDEVPGLKHKLNRVLFSPGIHYLQDPRTKVFNFDPYLLKIPTIEEFQFNKIGKFISSFKDKFLSKLAIDNNLKYYSSTSSMTSTLSQFHFLLSNFRPINFITFSKHQEEPYGKFTKSSKLPSSIIVKKQPNGAYAIESDKSTDQEIILSLLGQSLERFLTKDQIEFSKYLTKDNKKIEESNTYHYATINKFLMRSQLDCYDSRLPGTGTFDLKTRAVNAVRYDISKVTKESTGYQILKTLGKFESFEREQVDLAKSTLLKYSLQARIGNMDGIFIAYHNTVKIFGFEYLPLSKIDEMLHSFCLPEYKDYESNDMKNQLSVKLAQDEFKISMKLWTSIMDMIIEKDFQNNSSFRLIMKAVPRTLYETILTVIAVPISQENIELLQTIDSSNIDGIDQLNKKIYKESLGKIVGYDVIIKNFINDKESYSRHTIIKSLKDKWTIGSKIIKLNDETVESSYFQYLRERVDMLRKSTSVEDHDSDNFVNILRKYGLKGEKMEKLDKDREIVWNNE